MGYNTKYKLEVDWSSKDNLGDVDERFEDITGMGLHQLDEEPMKWYDYDTDMKKVSLLYPDTVFTLTGVGEDKGDLWRCYFKNGKDNKVDAITTYPPFDENELR